LKNSRSTPMAEEYLTIAELSERLKVKPKTIKNKMARGIFQRGVHYFSPPGLGPRFKWSAVVTWLEQGKQTEHTEQIFRAHKTKGLDISEDVLVHRTLCPVRNSAR
jgi:hypothetical protein